MEELRDTRPFLAACGLESRSSSNLVQRVTEVEVGILDAEMAKIVRSKALALVRYVSGCLLQRTAHSVGFITCLQNELVVLRTIPRLVNGQTPTNSTNYSRGRKYLSAMVLANL